MKWSSIIDRHIEGETRLGKVWIRLDRGGSASGIYLPNGVKVVPPDGTLPDRAKGIAEDWILNLLIEAKLEI